MSKKIIILFIGLLVLIIVAVLIIDFNTAKIENRDANPYEFDIDEFKHVDQADIGYREIKQIRINSDKPHGIAYQSGHIYLLHDSLLKIINLGGQVQTSIRFNDEPRNLTVTATNTLLIAFKNCFKIFSADQKLICESKKENEKSIFTSIASTDTMIFIADAGNRRVLMYTTSGTLLGDIKGATEADSKHGFIVPSPYFDLGVNKSKELWVVNPGKHQFQQYTTKGRLQGFWERSSMQISGFSGCCNPAHFSFLPNGDFVTSEKGMVRIKIHHPSGDLKSVVAIPAQFPDSQIAPDVCCDENGNIIALDFNTNTIRIFGLK